MTTGVLFCCWPLLTAIETYQRRNCLLRVPSTPVVRTYWGAFQVCIESRPAIPSNAVQPKGFKFWLKCTSFPVLLHNHQWGANTLAVCIIPVVCYMTVWKLETGFSWNFALINCIALSLNYFLPKTPIARQAFKLVKLSYNLVCVWPCIIIVGKVI